MRAHREPNMLGKASYFSWIIIILCLLALPRGAQAQPGSPRMTASTTTSVTIAWDGVGAGATYEYQQVLPRLRSSVNVGSGTTTTITSLSHSTYYGFQIRSILNGVTSDWTGVADGHTKPLAPPNFRATCVAGTFVELKWNAPQQSQVSLSPTSFQYEVKINSGAWQSRAGSRTRKVGQLSLGTTYTFAVRTVLDRSGFVGYSDASTLTVTTAAAQVEPPTGLQTSEVSNTSVKLTWTASTTTVSSYEVSIDGNTWVDSGSDLEHTFSGLDPETRYSLRARAKSGNSTSCANAAPQVTTLPSAPSAPTGLTKSGISQTAITLSWTKSAGATAYKVRKDSSDSWTTLDDVASHTFTGLTANTQYTLEVIASNAGGDSSATSVSARTLVNAPATPTGLADLGGTHNSITISWSRSTGATGYKVQVDSGTVATLGDVATHTFSGLTADTSYTLNVVAFNSGGDSAAASVSARTKLTTPPVTLGTVTHNSIVINWTKSTGATAYKVRKDSGDDWTTLGDVATHTFSGLTPNTAYDIEVLASNSHGDSAAGTISGTTTHDLDATATHNANLTATHNANLTATANANLTATANANLTATQLVLSNDATQTQHAVNLTATANAPTATATPTPTPTATSTPTPTPTATATPTPTPTLTNTPLPGSPAAPTGLSMSGISQTAITLSWTKSTGATAYKVQVDSGAVTTLGDVATHTFSGLSANTSYTLKVIASNSGGDSSAASVSASTLPNAPAAPTGLSTSGISQTAITISWTKSAGATGYKVQVDSGAVTTLGDVATHTFSGLSANTSYTLKVIASNSGGDSSAASVSASTLPNAPAAPTGLSTSGISQTAITISWTKSAGATGYKVQANSGTVTTLGDVATHTFSGLSASTSYTLNVIASNSGGDSSAASVSASTLPNAPAAPTGLSASGISQTAITISWTKSAGATGYKVQANSGTVATLGDVATHTFSGLSANTSYTLKVIAFNSGGDSSAASVSASTLPNAPAAPTGLSTSGISQTAITLGWTKSTGATGYKVQANSGTVATLGDVATHTFSGLSANTSYTLTVIAFNSGGDSSAASVSASTLATQAAALADPTSVSTSGITQTAITLNWTKETAANSYEVQGGSHSSWHDVGDVATYEFTGLTADTQYTLKVRSKNSQTTSTGVSVSASTLANAPAAPTGLSTSGISQTAIAISWTKSTGATGYKVRFSGFSWVNLGDVATYENNNLSPGTQYTIEVVAKNSGGDSSAASVSASTLADAPAAPNDLQASPGGQNNVNLNWPSSAGADSYEIRGTMASNQPSNQAVSVGAISNWMDVGNVNSYVVTGLSPEMTYTFEVRAKNTGGASQPRSTNFRISPSSAPSNPPQSGDGDPVQGDSDTDNAGAALRGGSSSSASPTEDPNPKPSVINCSDEQRALFDISALMPGMNVQCLDHNSIFQPNLVARGVVLGVDVWGWVRGDFEVCFKQAGDIVFLDAAYAPRVQTSVTIYSRDGRSCIPLNRAGTLVLLKSTLNSPPPSAPQSSTVSAASAGSAANNQVVAFDNCQVRTLEYINFRESPGGNRILVLSPQVTLTAYDKQGDWFQADFYGQKGWLHGDYVKPIGDCG